MALVAESNLGGFPKPGELTEDRIGTDTARHHARLCEDCADRFGWLTRENGRDATRRDATRLRTSRGRSADASGADPYPRRDAMPPIGRVIREGYRSVVPDDAIRFGVGTPDGARSESWRIWKHRSTDDVYVGARRILGQFKASLHRDGTWLFGFSQDYADSPGSIKPPGDPRQRRFTPTEFGPVT